MKRLNLTFAAMVASIIGLAILIPACSTVTKDGPYKGDNFLYNADKTIKSTYIVTKEFLRFELANRAILPLEVTEKADAIRRDFPRWRESALAFRTAYAASPTGENRKALEKSLDIIQVFSEEALKYLIAHQKQSTP